MYAVHQNTGFTHVQIATQLFNIGTQGLLQRLHPGAVKVALAKYPDTQIAAVLHNLKRPPGLTRQLNHIGAGYAADKNRRL